MAWTIGGHVGGARRGLTAVLEGARDLARQRAWWPWVAAPALVTAVGLVLALVGTAELAPAAAARAGALVGGTGWGPTLLRGLLATLAIVLVFAANSVVALVAGKIAAGPFLDLLSDRVERDHRPDRPRPETSWRHAIAEALRGATHSALAGALYLALACPLTAVQLVPGVGTALALPLGIAVSAVLVAREAFDYPMSRRRWSFATKLGALWRTARETMGLGVGVVGLLAVPVVNLLAMPIAVIAATRLFVDLDDEGAYRADGTNP